MARPDDVELLTDVALRTDGSAAPEPDDVIELGPRRAPRWVMGAVCALVLVGIVGAVTARHASTRVASSAATALSPSLPPVTLPAVDSELGDVLPLDSKPVLDVAVSLNRTWILQSGQLVGVPGYHRAGVRGVDFTDVMGAVRLVLDPQADRMWLVVLQTPHGAVVEFDLALHRLRTTWSGAAISAAAALDGHLYLATAEGIADVAPGAREPVALPAIAGDVTDLAADRTRSRIVGLALGGLQGARVLQFTPGSRPILARRALPFAKGELAVTGDGAIWAGGYGATGAVLVRLDPASLQVTAYSEVATELGPGAQLVAAGDGAVWVRSGAGGNALYCIDGRTGGSQQVWSSAPGAVASAAGVAYLATGAAAVHLPLDRCPG
jgi:outer membrane protein assembly factor BamB